MTAPTEAEIRAFIESHVSDWAIEETDTFDVDDASAFEDYIDGAHVTDEDFRVFTNARTAAFRELRPALAAAMRPFIIEAQVQGAMAFFANYPEAPRKRQLITTR